MDPEEEDIEEVGPEEAGQGNPSLSDYDRSHTAGGEGLHGYQDADKGGAEAGDKSGGEGKEQSSKKDDGSGEKKGKAEEGATGEKGGVSSANKGADASRQGRISALRNRGRQLKGAAQDPAGTAEELLKKQAKKRLIWMIGGAFGSTGGLLFILIVLAGLLMVSMLQGAQQETMTNGFCESIVGDLSCFRDKAKQPNIDPCYYKALRDAEKDTDVPWQILAAVDFKVWNQGAADDRGLTNYQALHQLGHEIQNANYKRDPVTGEIFISNTGKPEQGISLKGSYNDPQDFINAAVVMRHYECMYLTNGKYTGENLQNLLACYKCETHDGLAETLKDKWVSQNSLVEGMALKPGTTATWKNTGAQSFYNYLMQNCEAIGLKSEKGGSGGGGGTTLPPGIGEPGQRDGNNIPILPNYKQGNWGGDGDPSSWADRTYDFFGCSMADCGCSITSAAMVLSWYGCGMDPGKALDVANANYHGGTDMGGVFGSLGSSCGLCTRNVPDIQGIRDFLTSTHEPLVVGVTQTMDGHYQGGHYVAVAGYDGTNYYVYDGGQNGPMVTVPAGEFESYVSGDGDNWAYYKSSGGCQ